MKKLKGIVSVELCESLTELTKRLGIDIKRYLPIRFELHPFFSVYCLDLKESTDSREIIKKFEVLILDIERVDYLFETFNLEISIDQKYLGKEQNRIEVIEFPPDKE